MLKTVYLLNLFKKMFVKINDVDEFNYVDIFEEGNLMKI